jgi:hypothetical protein
METTNVTETAYEIARLIVPRLHDPEFRTELERRVPGFLELLREYENKRGASVA